MKLMQELRKRTWLNNGVYILVAIAILIVLISPTTEFRDVWFIAVAAILLEIAANVSFSWALHKQGLVSDYFCTSWKNVSAAKVVRKMQMATVFVMSGLILLALLGKTWVLPGRSGLFAGILMGFSMGAFKSTNLYMEDGNLYAINSRGTQLVRLMSYRCMGSTIELEVDTGERIYVSSSPAEVVAFLRSHNVTPSADYVPWEPPG